MAAFALNAVHAQDHKNLNKEITLEKDIAPIDKKVVKKNELPKVKKAVPTGTKNALGYSDLTTPIEVPTTIPTLLPYGYRTAHNFSNQRGYFDVGGGTQGNFRVDFGYRIINEEREKLGVWLNHNSTWNSKNPSKQVNLNENRNKQKYNDNTLAVDYSRGLGAGTFTMGAKFHIDSYNYYGGWNGYDVIAYDENGAEYTDHLKPAYNWANDKQTFVNFDLNAGWASRFMLRDKPLRYNVGLQYGHAAYDKPFDDKYKKGAHDNWGILTLGGSYDLTELTTAALGIKGEYLSRGAKAKDSSVNDLFDEVGMITLSPTYTVLGDMYKLQLGLNAHISFSDGAAFRLSPNVRANVALVDGFSLFANFLGGKSLGYRVPTHFYNYRYDYPLLMYGSIYTPLDAELGVKAGPFQGLSGKLSVGYAIVKDQPGICYYGSYVRNALMNGMMSTYTVIDGRGYYFNAEINYKYRSLLEASASIKYAPHDDELFTSDKHYNNYKLGVDRASTVANIDLKVIPWRPLTLNAGLEYRGGRMALFRTESYFDGEGLIPGNYTFVDMDDAINLHAGANYRLNSNINLWLQTHNLLNRRYDILYGQGAQRIGFMLGAGFTF